MEKIIVAGLATLPERLNTLHRVLTGLHRQVDVIEVSLNGHENLPKFASEFPKAIFTFSSNKMGDANKFLNIEKYDDAYYFSCDDDIEYPPDYTSKYIEEIKKHKCLVSIHGSVINNAPILSYYKGRTMKAHCLRDCGYNEVQIVGSGVSGFDTSQLKLKYLEFKIANMADIWLSMQADKQGVKMLCIEHKGNWITGGMNKGRATICEAHCNNDSVQTKLVNDYKWREVTKI